MGKWAKFGQAKMGSGRGQTQNFSSTGSIRSKSCDPQPFERLPRPKMGSGRGQNQNSGTIGSKSCDPNPPLSASHGAQRGVGVTTFRPNGPPERLTALSELTPLSEFSPLSYIQSDNVMRWSRFKMTSSKLLSIIINSNFLMGVTIPNRCAHLCPYRHLRHRIFPN